MFSYMVNLAFDMFLMGNTEIVDKIKLLMVFKKGNKNNPDNYFNINP